jgi:hypothetical protein
MSITADALHIIGFVVSTIAVLAAGSYFFLELWPRYQRQKNIINFFTKMSDDHVGTFFSKMDGDGYDVSMILDFGRAKVSPREGVWDYYVEVLHILTGQYAILSIKVAEYRQGKFRLVDDKQIFRVNPLPQEVGIQSLKGVISSLEEDIALHINFGGNNTLETQNVKRQQINLAKKYLAIAEAVQKEQNNQDA